MILSDICVFVFIWITMFLWHESMHSLETFRQGGRAFIEIRFKKIWKNLIVPIGAYFSTDGNIYDKNLVNLTGGVYTSPVCFLMTFFTVGVWQFSFLVLGWVQLCYGVFEMLYLPVLSKEWYRLGRYMLYLVVVFVNLFLWLVIKI